MYNSIRRDSFLSETEQETKPVSTTKNSVAEIGSLTSSNRVIRKVVLLDPMKIKKLGLESKIIQAVNKFNDKPTIQKAHADGVNNIGRIANKCIEYESAKNKVSPSCRVAKSKPDILSGKVQQRLSEVGYSANSNKISKNSRKRQLRIEDPKNTTKDFNGFTNDEIVVGQIDLIRLSDIIKKYKQVPNTLIPSFTHLRTYLCSKKSRSKDKINKSERRWSCPLSSLHNVAGIHNDKNLTTANSSLALVDTQLMNTSPSEINHKPKSEQIISSKSAENFHNLEENRFSKIIENSKKNENHSDQKADDCIDPVPILRTNTLDGPLVSSGKSNKGIVILDQKIIKSGTYQRVQTEAPSIKISKTSILENAQLASKQADRTILVKILGQDSDSKDIHIEVIDPLIKMQPPEKPIDPIKSICKSYVKKMLKSSGIKRIKINTIDRSPKKLPLMSTSTVCELNYAKCEKMYDGDMKPNGNLELLENARKCSKVKALMTRPISKFAHEPGRDRSLKTFGSQNFASTCCSHRSSTHKQPTKGDDTNLNVQSISSPGGSNIARVINDEPMDAVEYILHCAKDNDIANSVSKFEDEEDLEEVDWGDQDDGAAEFPFQELSNKNSESFDVIGSTSALESNRSIMNMIEQAEITFESDVKHESRADENHVNSESKSEDSSGQLISGSTTSMTAANDNISVFTIKEILPAIDINNELSTDIACQEVTSEECRITSLKKRKCTIMNYKNMNTTLIAEIKERIKQRMIGKTEALNNLQSLQENKAKPVNEFENLERVGLGMKLCDEVTCKKVLENECCLEDSVRKQKVDPLQFIHTCDIKSERSSSNVNVKIENNSQLHNSSIYCNLPVQSGIPSADQIQKVNADETKLEEKFQYAQKKSHLHDGKGRRYKITPVMHNSISRVEHEKAGNIEISTSCMGVNLEKSVSEALIDKCSSELEFGDTIIEGNSESWKTQKKAITEKKTDCFIRYADVNIQKEKAKNRTADITENSNEGICDQRASSLYRNRSAVTNVDNVSEATDGTGDKIKQERNSNFVQKYSEDEKAPMKDHDLVAKERKSNRMRKPINKVDFVPITKKRKEKPEKEQVVDFFKLLDDSGQQTRRIGGDEVKIQKSRRKNTIPEIDKLALKRRSMKAEFENSKCIKEDNLNVQNEGIDKAVHLNEKELNMIETITGKKETNEMKAANSNLTSLCETAVCELPKENGRDDVKCIRELARKRGRPRKNQINKSKSSTTPPLVNEVVNSITENSPTVSLEISEGNRSKYEVPSVLEEPLKKRRKGNASDYEIHPKILLVSSPEELKKAEMEVVKTVKTEPIPDSESVQCGACKCFVRNSSFKEHLKKHYGVGWREGFDKPINLGSYRDVMNAMHYYMMRNKIVSMSCKVCGETKKSAAGVIMHLQSCLLDEQQLNELLVSCEFCSKTFLPPALWTHLKTCRKNPDNLAKGIVNNEKSIEFEPRRKSAIKANSSFKALMEPSFKLTPDDLIKLYQTPRGGGLILRWKSEIKKHGVAKCFEKDCTFESAEIFAMKIHIKSCPCIRHGGYYCIRCEYYDVDKENVRQHVLEQHSKHLNANIIDAANVSEVSNDSSVSERDLEMSEDGEEVAIDCENEINVTTARRRTGGIKDENTFAATEKICKNIYTSSILYPNLKPPEICSFQTKVDCIKPSIVKSIKFGITTTKQVNECVGSSKPLPVWNELEQFEMKKIEDEIIMFIGGPITHIAWAPIPISEKNNDVEYLAISYKSSYKSLRKFTDSLQENEIILVYQVTLKGVKKREITTELLYGIQCNGRVHCFAFLPSGGYAPDMNRLGVIAVGTAASCIHIYSLPLKASQKNCDKVINTRICKILEVKPSLILCVDLSKTSTQTEGCMAQCTRIVWSEVKDHNVIVAGFSNGYVGIWDIRENNLTRVFSNGYQYCIPFSYFNAISHSVSGLALHYAPTGPRWLFVTNHVREFQAYDLEDITHPTQLGPVGFQKSSLSSAVWPVYSENPVVALDDDYLDDTSIVFCRSILNLNYKMKNIVHCPSGLKCLEFTPWYNSLVGGCENGDIVVQRFRKFSMESSLSNMYPRWFVYFTDIVRLDGEPIPIVNPKKLEEIFMDSKLAETLDSFEPDYSNTHALIFGGPIVCDRHNKSRVVSNNRAMPTTLRPLTRINCIAICPNISSTDIAAIGYNNGLVRIKSINFNNFR